MLLPRTEGKSALSLPRTGRSELQPSQRMMTQAVPGNTGRSRVGYRSRVLSVARLSRSSVCGSSILRSVGVLKTASGEQFVKGVWHARGNQAFHTLPILQASMWLDEPY